MNVVYPVSSAITLKYDRLNRLTNMVDTVGMSAYSYDQVGQLLSEDGPWSNDTVSYTYANRLRSRYDASKLATASGRRLFSIRHAPRMDRNTDNS